MRCSPLLPLILGTLLHTACTPTERETPQPTSGLGSDSARIAAAINANLISHPDSALRLARDAQHQAGGTGSAAQLSHWQDRELDVLIRLRDTSLVRVGMARLARREGDAAATTAEQLARWFKTNGNSVKADSLAQVALRSARSPENRARALCSAALPMADLGSPQAAMDLLQEAETLIDTVLRQDLHARWLHSMAYIQYRSGMLTEAAISADNAIRSFTQLGDTLVLLSAYSTRAAVATSQNDVALAMELQRKVIALATVLGFPNLVAANTFNLANTEKSLKHYDDALKGYEVAWRTADSCGMVDLALIARGARAILWADMDSASLIRAGLFQTWQDSTLPVLNRAINDMRSIRNRYWEMNFTLTKAEAHNWFGERDSARMWYPIALRMAEEMQNPQMQLFALGGIGTGAYYDKDYPAAIRYWERAIALNEELGIPEQDALTWDRLHIAYKETGQLGKALDALKRSKDIGFALYNDTLTQRAAEIEAKFTYAQKAYTDSLRHTAELRAADDQRTIAELRAQRSTTAAWGVGGAAVLIMGGGLFAWRIQRRRRDAEAARALAEADRRAAEFQNAALRAQMDEHFISNTLNAVNAHLYTNDPDAASTLLQRFAQWIRTMLETSQHATIPLKDDLEALRAYLELQRSRLDGRFDFAVEVDPAIDTAKVSVPPLVVQPLLENAIEHGVGSLKEGGRITLSAGLRDGSLLLSVEDNGVGRAAPPDPSSKRGRKSSLSTRIIRDQLELLRLRTGRAAELRTIDLPQGTRVEVELPLLA